MRPRSPLEPAGMPSTSTTPSAIRCTPTMARISVVLPLPLGPSRPVTDPRSISQLRAGRTTLPPRTTRDDRCAPRCSLTLREARRIEELELRRGLAEDCVRDQLAAGEAEDVS